MAHIFKHPTASAKGIIVFTHKEMNHYLAHYNLDLLRRIRNLLKKSAPDTLKLLLTPGYFKPYLHKLKEKYFIGVHFGFHMEKVDYQNLVDFYMVADSNLKGQNDGVHRINLVSRNFIPDIFNNDPTVSKYWDLICVARTAQFKKLDKLLQSLKKIYSMGHKYKALLIIPSGENETTSNNYTDLMKDYYAMFDRDQRENFTIIKLSSKMAFPGLPPNTISHFYQSSKIFVLFSDVEGGPKVLTEALLCGLKVVVNKNLKGGGLDTLTPESSFQFENYETAHETVINAVENYKMSDKTYQEIYSRCSFESSLKKLKEHFKIIFQNQHMNFDGELINLDRLHQRLPAHTNDGIPWAKLGNHTGDVYSIKNFHEFLTYLGEGA